MAGARHVVMIVVDQLRADIAYHEAFPYVRTPHIDRLRSEGVTFERAYCQYPVCAPARASITTGRYPQQHGVLHNRCLPGPDARTLGHHFADAGYDAVAFGKTHGQNPGFRRFPEPPLAETLGTRLWGWYQGQDMLSPTADPVHALTPVLDTFEAGKEQHYDFIVARQIRDYLLKRDADGPLLLWAGFHTPHPPLHPPREFADLYDPADIVLPDVDPALADTKPPMQRATGKEWKQTLPDVRRRMIAAYLALVTHVDDAIGRLLATLDETGILQDALVVFVSDHGEQLGEHDMLGKFNMFYEGSMRVPLVIRLPDGSHAGETRGQLVEHVDLFPTLCTAAGLAPPRGLAGRDLSPVIADVNAAHREHVSAMLVEKGAHRADSVHSGETFTRGCMVRTDRWKLAVYSDGDGELYDLDADPHECVNLFRSNEHAAIREGLYRRIIAHQLTYTRDEANAGLNHFPG